MPVNSLKSGAAAWASLALLGVGTGALAQSAAPPAAAPIAPLHSPAALAKLYELGFLAYKADAPQARALAGAAYARWRNETGRTDVKPMAQPLSPAEVTALLAQPLPTAFGAISGQTMGIFGKASKQPNRDAAEAVAKADCLANGGTRCDTIQVVAGGSCIGVSGFSANSKITLVSLFGADAATASAKTMESCRQDPESAGQCKPLVTLCADGR